MEGLSERAYAAHAGFSRGAVQKARKTGRLVLFADGSIDAAASDARRSGMTDPDQQRRSTGGDGNSVSGPADSASYLKARTALTVYQAQERQLAIQRKKGALVDRARAETLVFRLARQERDVWITWPTRVAALMAAQLSADRDGFALLTTFGTRARMGVLAESFYAGPVSRFDLGNALVVDLFSGTLESVTDITLLDGANALAVETGPGQWEIVQAGSAELIAPGRYRLTRLLRGQRGTENTMGNPAPTGSRVVVLDAALASLPISEADLGLPWNWRIGPVARPVSDETYVVTSFTPEGAGLRPFSVAHVEQPWRKPRSPGDLTIRWTRRARALAADTWGAGEVPLAEDSEAYEVEILDGAVVKRSLTTDTTSALYTAAQQTADWGAPLGPGQALDIRIYQLSALIGRGVAKTTTLKF